MISANHVEELEKLSQEKNQLNLDHEKTKSDLEQRLENLEKQLSTANDNIKELEADLIAKKGVIADSEAKINEVNESLENQILDKIQVEEKIDEFKDEIQKKNSEVKDLTNSLNMEKQMAEELRSQMDKIKNQLSTSMETNEKLEKLVIEKDEAIRNAQNDMGTELDSVKSKIQNLEQDNEKLIQDKKCMANELIEIKEQLHDAIKVAEDRYIFLLHSFFVKSTICLQNYYIFFKHE